MPRLTIFSNFYAPEYTGIAPYTTEVAEHMAEQGWAVKVVTGMPHYPQWRVQEPYRRRFRARETRRGVDVRRVRQYVPAQQSAPGRALYEASFFGHALSHAAVRPGDCVVGVVPGIGGGGAAAVAARLHRVPLGLIVQDLVGQAASQSGMPGGGLAAKPATAIETRMLRQADGVAIIAEPFRAHLERAGVSPERIVHLPNWTHVASPANGAVDVRRSLGWGDTEQVVLHAGNMGFKQDLSSVVEAARVASRQGLPVRFVLMGDGNDRRRLEGLAADVASLQFLDPSPTETFMDVLAAADVLLVNERATVVDMSLPSKITSYFRAGRPVVAAVAPGGATESELRRSDAAVIVPAGDPARLVAAVRSLAEDKSGADRLVQAAFDYAARQLDREALLGRAERFISDLARLRRPLEAHRG